MTDERDNGCLCQRCHCRYRVDFILPDELWAKIRGACLHLCGTCIVELTEAREEHDYFNLVKLDPVVIDPQSNFDDSVADDGSWVKPYSEVK